MQDEDISATLQMRVLEAAASDTPLWIRGGGSKDFYGCVPRGEVIDLNEHSGIISYEPTELVITARAGTPLIEIEEALASQSQMLAFEPPGFGQHATIGGTIACNLSGPRRPYTGAARDFLLGTKLLNGKGDIMSFGGEVMKNVAGYDVSRLMAGAMGTLGILLEVSLKVLPRPEQDITLVQEGLTGQEALDKMHKLSRLPLPISGSCYDDGTLFIRLSGTAGEILAARKKIGAAALDAPRDNAFWDQLNNHGHTYFGRPRPLWRLSVASNTPPIAIEGDWLYEWGGAQRWLTSDAPAMTIRESASRAGGHATLYRYGNHRTEVFHPLDSGLAMIHRQLKKAFDPKHILNPGRMYQEL